LTVIVTGIFAGIGMACAGTGRALLARAICCSMSELCCLTCAEKAQPTNGETRQTILRRPHRYRAHTPRQQRDDGRLWAARSALQQARRNDRKTETRTARAARSSAT